MAQARCPDELLKETVQAWVNCNRNVAASARATTTPETTFKHRLHRALSLKTEAQWGVKEPLPEWSYPKALHETGGNLKVLVGGDAHLWSKDLPVMCQMFINVAKKVKPDIIVLNGDIIDGARVSSHRRYLGVSHPSVAEEIDAAKFFISKLPMSSKMYWTIGNHDQRVDFYLANAAPELEDYAGRLSDRFPQAEFCYALFVNAVEIRHRFRGGIHAGWNNALHSGTSTVTNHTHQLQVTAVRNRNGTHWGIETGMLGDPESPAFEYTEGTQSRAHQGFALLSFDEEGFLLPPEFCEMLRGRPVFRTQYLK